MKERTHEEVMSIFGAANKIGQAMSEDSRPAPCSPSLIRVGFNLSDGRTIEVEKMEKDYGEWVYVTTKEGLFHTTYRDLFFFMQNANGHGSLPGTQARNAQDK